MNLNIEKLENVKYRNFCIIARCPACAETGHDNKGNHLSIDEHGCFSCVVYQGDLGKEHRKRIFALVGVKDGNEGLERHNKVIKVKRVTLGPKKVIKKDILGRLGRVNLTHARKEKNDIEKDIIKRDFEKGVPSVPSTEMLNEMALKTMEEIQNNYVGVKNTQSAQEAIGLIKELWANCEKGTASIEDFKKALKKYKECFVFK